ncbi:MAG: DegT/DnrJ/EryC1/StrS family aminotransferase, partial [Thermoanaerobaculia bacterium]
AELPGRRHIYNQFVIRFTGGRAVRDGVMDHLKSRQIGCEVYYPITLPQQECFRAMCEGESFPNSDTAADQSLAIPIYPELVEAQLVEVVREIAEGLKKK